MINAALVKELREKTGAGMLDCKNALVETDGDIEKAIDWLREKGIAKAAKKAGRIAAEGLVKIASAGDKAVVLEMNSETDFVAKNEKFLSLLDLTAQALLDSPIVDLPEALALPIAGLSIAERLTEATALIGEKIDLRRFASVTKASDESFGLYTHFDGRIAVVAVLQGGDQQVAKDIAMQIASMAPSFISREEISEDFIARERAVQQGIMANDEDMAKKPENIQNNILEGRISKALQELCLRDQVFFKDSNLKVSQYLQDHQAVCRSFIRYEVGEGLEKKTADFADEVASML